jgi:hypothetical protein
MMMGVSRQNRRWLALLAAVGLFLAMGVLAEVAPSSSGASSPSSAGTHWTPANKTSEVDCNGWSSKYSPVKASMRSLCTDPIQIKGGKAARFIDNGWYVGHDEPSVKFISNTPGTGNTMTYYMEIPVDPTKAPAPSGSVTDYGQLSIAPWFGLPICDPLSYPQKPCKPDSNSNNGSISDPDAAGSAFLELQLYPPGFTPFVDSESCSQTQWCGALTIDSLECSFGFATCNPDCEEPGNFAFLQTNGVPTGPPSPQLADVTTYLPNADTLMINPGDVIQISISDPTAGLTTTIRDLTTGETGYMVASSANGFMDTNIKNCDGRPFTFHAEYSSAAQKNQVPWAALEGGVLMEEEIGHSEVCNALAYKEPYDLVGPHGQSFEDPDTYQTCIGGSEGRTSVGEGPCNEQGICRNAETEGTTGPIACPTDNAGTGQLCEFADGFCFPKGDRMVMVDHHPVVAYARISQCFADRWQNGDLDFDGLSYISSSWPDGTADHPTPVRYVGPFDAKGNPYPTIQFESDIAGSEFLCDTTTGTNCDVKPLGSDFYPFYSLNDSEPLKGVNTPAGACVWNFGRAIKGLTTQDFGGDAEYGTPAVSRYGGTLISPPTANPEFTGSCPSFHE